MTFQGKKVWIIGASSGIGAALAVEMAHRGATCVLSARRVERLNDIARTCADPERHVVYPLDATDFASHEAAAQDIERQVGPLDIVVLNAGVGQRGHALDTEFDIERGIMELNYLGTISVAKAVGRKMRARQAGTIVVISSVLGRLSIPGSSSYSASKHALHGYFESLRAELYPHGVNVTIVCPGYINTEFTVHALQEDGSRFGVIDHNHTYGMDADVCAGRICDGVEKRRPVLVVGGTETWGILLARLFPGLARRTARGYSRK